MEINKNPEGLKRIQFLTAPNSHRKIGLDISKLNTIGEFHDAIVASEYTAPTTLYHGLSQLMKANNLTFQEAFRFLLDNKKIIIAGNKYIYDLSASKLWEKNSTEKSKKILIEIAYTNFGFWMIITAPTIFFNESGVMEIELWYKVWTFFTCIAFVIAHLHKHEHDIAHDQ